MTSLGCLCLKPGSFEIFGCNYVCIYVCTSPHLPRFQVWPSKSRLFCSQSIDSERKQKNVQNMNKVWCGKLKMESTRKLSNFYFQWGKTLYQNNLTNIAFFFTFFKGLRCNKKSSVVTPKKISHGRQRKWMSNFTRYVIAQVLKILKISCVKCYNSVKFDIHFLGLPWEIFFGVTTDDLLLNLKPLKNVRKNAILLYF